MATWKDEYQYKKFKQHTLERFQSSQDMVDFYQSLFAFIEAYAENAEDAMRVLKIPLREVNLQHIALNLPVTVKNMPFGTYVAVAEVILGTYWVHGKELGELLGIDEDRWEQMTEMEIL